MRADVFLTENQYASSRRRAQELILEGNVVIDGRLITKPATQIGEGEHDVRVTETLAYVGRGGCKLEAALDRFGISAKGLVALDIGASTGGFTDCLLSHGATRVYAVDSGSDQLAQKLRDDPRVICREHLNARTLTREDLCGETVDLIVMDVSFISATLILPVFGGLLAEGGQAVCLIKPQFEVGRSMIGKGGVVKDPAAHRYAIERVVQAAELCGLSPVQIMPSPIRGGDGNREFLIHLSKNETEKTLTPGDLIACLRETQRS